MAKKTTKKLAEEKEVKKTTKTSKKSPMKKETKAAPKKPSPVKKETLKKTEPKTEKFVSMCGSDFDPSKKGECLKSCKKDFPKDFAACEANFKVAAKAKSRSKAEKKVAAKKPVDIFGNRVGSNANMINQMLLEGATLAEIAASTVTTIPRVKNHIRQYLVEKKGIEVMIKGTKDGEIAIINDVKLVHPDALAFVKEGAKALRQ